MGPKRNAYRTLVGKKGERPLGIPRSKLVDNIKMNQKNRMGWYGLD
jgi:hypothetical protein